MVVSLDHLSVNNRLLTIITLTLTYLTKFVLYRYLVELDEGLNAWQTIGAYTILVGVSMVLACVGMRKGRVFLSLISMLLIDIWLVANIIYYKSNFLLLDWQVILIADNLNGFEDSIIAYLQWQIYLIPVITIITAIFLIIYRSKIIQEPISWKKFLFLPFIGFVIYLVGLGIGAIGNKVYARENEDNWVFEQDKKLFLKIHSPIGHIGMVLWDGIEERILHFKAIAPLTSHEEEILSAIYTGSIEDSILANPPHAHMVFILVESLESWPLLAKDINGVDVCENINQYIHSHNVLFCPNLTSQQVYGRSGDGQLITQTGLLPLSSGVTCMTHGGNVYPNYAHFYQDGVVLNPYSGIWNQRVTTYSYGYKRLRESSVLLRGTDSLMVSWAIEELQKATEPTCVLLLTINTHAPFNSVESTLQLPPIYSRIEAKYLQTVHYMDKHVGRFLAWADTAQTMSDATIVITADHNHFPRNNGKGLCPLIIKSPLIDHAYFIREAYQMDIFPTVLHAIGQMDYNWKGFGVDLLNDTVKRQISDQQAYALSDKMIRTNFFKKE